MKKHKYMAGLLAASLMLGTLSCTDMLDESPKSQLTPDYFRTAQGVDAGLISAYSGLRWLFGPDGALVFTIPGTDEFMCSNAMNGTQGALDSYDSNYSPSNGTMNNYWNNGFQFINTCNGVIQYGAEASGLTASEKTALLAQAHFLRGLYYYLITMNYGDCPLDLGSGKLAFNISPTTTSVRDSRKDVLETIIADFTYAAANLPDKPSETGRVAKPAALHFLAKAYLTRANLYGAADDYRAAYDQAKSLIDNASSYSVSLLENYADVHTEGNENSAEILFNVQRTWTSSGPNLEFEESNDGSYAVANKGNRANFFFTAGYENLRVTVGSGTVQITPRCLEYQRPWRMLVPTTWLLNTAFSDKDNDARFDDSFRLEWKAGNTLTVKGRTITAGKLGIKISLTDVTAEAADSVSTSGNGVIYKPYATYALSNLYNADGTYRNSTVNYIYPTLKKYDDTKRATINYDSNRPYILARLAETYLIAAEAAMNLGNTSGAATLINVVRQRAAYRSGLSNTELAARQTAMSISASDVTLDFILDERAREMCGESWRWIDLVRTGKLLERVKAYNPNGASNIQSHHVLRPIPQDQIDLLSDPAQKAAYQNTGYN